MRELLVPAKKFLLVRVVCGQGWISSEDNCPKLAQPERGFSSVKLGFLASKGTPQNGQHRYFRDDGLLRAAFERSDQSRSFLPFFFSFLPTSASLFCVGLFHSLGPSRIAPINRVGILCEQQQP